MRDHVCAVDVGTGSARAGIFDRGGTMIGRGEHPIAIRRPQPDHAEHDADDIWRAVCHAVREALAKAHVLGSRIGGLGFDATCSLVVRGRRGEPLGVSKETGDPRWDTITWLDHRAIAEAEICTMTGHRVVDHIGKVMSPEMEVPKLMWLKRHRPDTWTAAAHFLDLADYLTWRATGSAARSQCTLTCKWTYLAHQEGWQHDFLRAVGLDDMLERGGLPQRATPVGASLGPLAPQAAEELGLDIGCMVATGLIDAFAGAIGVVGRHAGGEIGRHAALVAGTSSCVMVFADAPRIVPGVWGPYWGAALPGHWLSEGGQSATGALLDHVIRLHRQGGEPDARMHARIVGRIRELRAADAMGADLHVLPDFHGNRSPFADPHARGALSGLTLDASFDGLCRLYWRGCVAIALGVRHIIDHLNAHGHGVDTLHVTGGHTRNPLLMELYTEATCVAVIESEAEDAVLLGAAMAGAAAAGWHAGLAEACRAMAPGERRRAANGSHSYERDYRIFLAMHRHQHEIAAL